MLISINGASGRCSLFASDICVLKTTRTSARTWFTPPYNSPFRPFLLTSTSTGQEGLDFYPWCHRLVHWNLPGNPVDLEQREGHVHWYKGHAVRHWQEVLRIGRRAEFKGKFNIPVRKAV